MLQLDNESLYDENLSTDSVLRYGEEYTDFVNRENSFAKAYGDYDGYVYLNYSVETLADNELNQIVQSIHEKVVNAYSPKFYGVECQEYAVMLEVVELLGLSY